MHEQLNLDTYRMELVKDRWNTNLEVFREELFKSKKPKDKKLYKRLGNLDMDKALSLLKHYIERCKLKHSLAFFQFRKKLPNADKIEIKKIFDGRRDHLNKVFFVAHDELNKHF